jgi:glycine C-acetyltransferase
MTPSTFDQRTRDLLQSLHDAGQYKHMRYINSPMSSSVRLDDGRQVLCLCSNNYLGLADHPDVIAAGIQGLQSFGAGTASVRFICGTLTCHRRIEHHLAQFLAADSALTYVSCWTANQAAITTIAAPDDAIISDELNHASIIDACRLLRQTERAVYKHNDMDDLQAKLKQLAHKATRWVVTDGVFSMEGDAANLPRIHELCKQYDAKLIVDDSHGVGVLGDTGRGTPQYANLLGQIDILTGTLGKALGGAAGGYVAASAQTIELLEQRSRPALFSNALPATVAFSADKAIDIIEREPQRLAHLHHNVTHLRQGLKSLGYHCPDSPSAIIPIIVGDTAKAIAMSQRLFDLGVWVVGFGFPVVPEGHARLRIQASAALDADQITQALDAFAKL